MFPTFQVAEPGHGKLTVYQQTRIYDNFTFYSLLLYKSHRIDTKIDEIFDMRVNRMKSSGIKVPQDCRTLKDAVELSGWHTGNGKYAKYANLLKRFPKIVIGKGEHVVAVVDAEDYKDELDDKDDANITDRGGYLHISSHMNIVGDTGVPKEEIVVVGGIWFKTGIPGNCHLQNLTLRQSKGHGVLGWSSFTMKDVIVEQCRFSGVCAIVRGERSVVARCKNVEVRECGLSGVVVGGGALITLIGDKTKVHQNCAEGDTNEYGLKVWGGNSNIQLVYPLTKENVSINNIEGLNNWGANSGGKINQIKTITEAEFIEVLKQEAEIASQMDTLTKLIKATTNTSLTVNMPEDSNLNEFVKAVDLVNMDNHLTADKTITIVVGKGEHKIDGQFLDIYSPMNIVGDPGVPKSEIVIVGGILFVKGIPKNCHLQHLTLCKAKHKGVFGWSSFTMTDVLVKECEYDGVYASGDGVVARCTNVEVRKCGRSGVVANHGASIALIGAKTMVQENSTKGEKDEYGLAVSGSSSSTIQLVSPLTKETVSLYNNGGRNWGAADGADINQIKTI